MDSNEVALEVQINALREQQVALESHLGLPEGQTHHSFHDAAVKMIREEQQREVVTHTSQTTHPAAEGGTMTEECATCCPWGCCPRCCLCAACCGAGAPSLEANDSPCECGCAGCVRGSGECRRRGYTRYYYNAESQRGVVPLPRQGHARASRSQGAAGKTAHAQRTRSCNSGTHAAFNTDANTADAGAEVDAAVVGLSLHERLHQIEQMRRKYSRMARRAMQSYQHTLTDHEGYEAERQRRLRTARPFSFEDRELTKPVRIREARMEDERRQREHEEQAIRHHQFKARGVPATTFMNKYDVMVEEWCQRKLAVEMLARERADQAKEEEAYVRLSAQRLRHAREEMMGARYDKHGKPITRSEAIRRAESAEAARRRRDATRPNDVPLEVQLKLWPALKEHEQVRKERILHQAKQAREETDVFFRQTMPLLASPGEARLFAGAEGAVGLLAQNETGTGAATTTTTTTTTTYGIGQPVNPPSVPEGVSGMAVAPGMAPPPPPPGAPAPAPLPQASAGVPLPNAYAAVPATPTAPAGALPPSSPLPPSSSAPPGQPPIQPAPSAPLATSAVGQPAVPAPVPGTLIATETMAPTTVAAPPSKAPVDPLELQRRYNANLTFKPHLKPGVPDFERLWAEERLALLERKQRRPATQPKPFHLTASQKETVVGKKRVVASRSVSKPRTQSAKRKHTHVTSDGTTTTTTTTTTITRTASPNAQTETATQQHTGTAQRASSTAPPKGTRAHALRTQAVYRQYVEHARDTTNDRLRRAEGNISTAPSQTAQADPAVDAYWRGVAERRKEVRQRLAAYLPLDPKLEHEEAIRSKVRTLRAAMRESEMSAQEKLDEMKTRVAQLPPVFAEPTHLNDLSKARAEAEKDILQMLKDTGLEARTIRDVLVRRPEEAEAAAAANTEASKPAEEAAKTGDKNDGEDEEDAYSTSDFASSSSSGSSSDSSDSEASAKGQKSGYGDDEFESSSSSDDSV